MDKWFYCKEILPPINKYVLVFTGESSYPYDIRKYDGKHQRKIIRSFHGVHTTEIETYDRWWDNNGGVYSNNPVAWQFINDKFTRNGQRWVEGRVV